MQAMRLIAAGSLAVIGTTLSIVSCSRFEKLQWGQIETVVAYASPEHAAFPGAVRTRAGEILTVFREGRGHVGPDGRILLIRSQDGGRSWSTPDTIIDTPYDDRDPSISEVGNGALLLNFFSSEYDSTGRRIRVVGVFVSRSFDNGKTWSDPLPVNLPEFTSMACSDNVLQLPTGRLLLPAYGQYRGDSSQTALVLISDDFGMTWSKYAITARDSTGQIDYQEPALEVLSNQTILCVLRTARADHWMATSHSTDHGLTWVPPRFIETQGQAADVLQTHRGTLIMGYRDFSPLGVSIRFSFDLGRSWEQETVLFATPADRAYTSLVELPGDELLVVYYADHAAWRFGEQDRRSAILASRLSAAPPEMPTGLSVSRKDSITVSLRWNHVPGAHYYNVYESANSEDAGTRIITPSDNQCRIRTAQHDSVSYFRVAAVRGTNENLPNTGAVGPLSRPARLRWK